jgi:hypothetical protein
VIDVVGVRDGSVEAARASDLAQRCAARQATKRLPVRQQIRPSRFALCALCAHPLCTPSVHTLCASCSTCLCLHAL